MGLNTLLELCDHHLTFLHPSNLILSMSSSTSLALLLICSVVYMTSSSPLSRSLVGSIQAMDTAVQCPANNDVPTYFPNPEDCHSFYQCDWGTPHLKTCPGDLYFDPALNVCNYSSQVNCVIENTPNNNHNNGSSEEGDDSSSSSSSSSEEGDDSSSEEGEDGGH